MAGGRSGERGGRAAPLALALAVVVAAACEKSDDGESSRAEEAPAASAEPEASAGAAEPTEAASEVDLYGEPVERRLYSDRIESSSYLWNSWNRFRENYHPNYIIDGDPATAWVEGADGSGEGEWIRAHTSRIEGATEIRLRIRNGYHKSESLFAKNARIRELELVVHPSGASSRHRLDDDMAWQEVEMPLEGEAIDGVELRALSVYAGSRYEDLVVSDIEIFATGLTVEDPAFEKRKLERIERWKRERIEAAKAYERADTLPVAAGYLLEGRTDKAEMPEVAEGRFAGLRRAVRIAGDREAPHRDALEEIAAGLDERFAGYVPVRLVAKGAEPVPSVDGVATPTGQELAWGRSDAFLIPATESFALLDITSVGAFDMKDSTTPGGAIEACDEPSTRAYRPPGAREGALLEGLVLVRCVGVETREGTAHQPVVQALRYDGEGRLALAAGPHAVARYEWDGRTISGGVRYWGNGRIEELSRSADDAP